MADISSTLRQWSATPGSNLPVGTTNIGTNLDNNLRELQAVVRKFMASPGSSMASAATVDLSTADGYYIQITVSAAAITSFGTESAGIQYLLRFAGALTLTHNATSLILPGAANITTAAGDLALMISEGSGNWRCVSYSNSSGVGFLQAGTGAIPRTVQAKLRESVSVLDFGADPTGVADSTVAIVAASALQVPLNFPAGTYVFNNSTLPAYVRWVGQGSSTVIKWKDSAASSNLLTLSGVVDATFSNIVFDANRQNQTDSTGYYGTVGGTIGNGSSVVFDRCEFINGRITDIYLTGPTGSGEYADVQIAKCAFSDGLVGSSTRFAQAVGLSEGIRLRCTENTFRQPTEPATYGRGGVVMQRPAGSTALAWGQFEATGNAFENFGRQTADRLGCLYVYSGSEATVIANNRFRNSIGTAIAVKSDCGATSVVGNVVNGHVDAVSAAISFFPQADAYTSSIGRSLVMTGNAVYDPEYQAIFIDGERNALADFKSAILSDNVCDGGLRGIHFRNVENLKIRGNLISNTTGAGIFGEDCAGDIEISGNTISTGVIGVDVNGTTTGARLSIDGNNISGLSATAIRLRTSVECFHIGGNRIAGCTAAFDTRGATEFSSIAENIARDDTTAWEKSGSYGALLWRGNATESAVPFATRTLTIAAGVVSVFSDFHYVDTEAAAASDDLDTINGGHEGRRLTLFAANSGRDVVLKDGTGNLRLAGDFTLTHADDVIELFSRGGVWYEIGRSDNTA